MIMITYHITRGDTGTIVQSGTAQQDGHDRFAFDRPAELSGGVAYECALMIGERRHAIALSPRVNVTIPGIKLE
jgi:hypothetical protein